METYESVKSNPVQPEQKEKKKGGAWKGIVAVILAAGVVGSTTISAFNLVTLKSYIAEQKKEENPETTEDYVKIADNYEIKPTTNISDAYKSGDTSKLTDKEKETLDMAKKATPVPLFSGKTAAFSPPRKRGAANQMRRDGRN